ncbi:MAG: hypothetical protein LUF30_12175 [Lachnospiraceae bacterium]|nr:hypothetical protein [Lachnospiraceae bacterium]
MIEQAMAKGIKEETPLRYASAADRAVDERNAARLDDAPEELAASAANAEGAENAEKSPMLFAPDCIEKDGKYYLYA